MSRLPLAGIVRALAVPASIVRERYAHSISTEGLPSLTGPTLTTLAPCVVHAVTGRELDRLPEGDRTREVVAVFTQNGGPFRTASADGPADVVRYQPAGAASYRRYEVLIAEDWTAQSGHYRCYAALVRA